MTAPPPQFPLPRQGAGPAPPRRPGSVRRTTSIDVSWPDGMGRASAMIGRARDIATPQDGGAPRELAQAGFRMSVSPRREILGLATDPAHPRQAELVGIRAGGASREALSATMADARGTPLFQLLDDFAGASLVAGWIWIHWVPDWAARARALKPGAEQKGPRVDICAGFAEGSSATRRLDRADREPLRNAVAPLPDPADPAGWHAMPAADGPTMPAGEGPTMRRARRIDLWRDGGAIRVDAGFQDSGVAPDGARIAVHEYRVHAVVDGASFEVRALQALPLILPFPECPAASVNASRIVGRPLAGFRRLVLEMFPGTEGCTHLNDVLRALADVPVLAGHLPA